MGYKFYIEFDGGQIVASDEYATEKQARDEMEASVGGYDQGGDVLELAGEGGCSAKIVNYYVEEV